MFKSILNWAKSLFTSREEKQDLSKTVDTPVVETWTTPEVIMQKHYESPKNFEARDLETIETREPKKREPKPAQKRSTSAGNTAPSMKPKKKYYKPKPKKSND